MLQRLCFIALDYAAASLSTIFSAQHLACISTAPTYLLPSKKIPLLACAASTRRLAICYSLAFHARWDLAAFYAHAPPLKICLPGAIWLILICLIFLANIMLQIWATTKISTDQAISSGYPIYQNWC
jgi:hypothetical protein